MWEEGGQRRREKGKLEREILEVEVHDYNYFHTSDGVK